MTWLTFLVAVGLLCVPSVSMVMAQTEPFRIRSAVVDPAGEVSAVVEFPPGPAPKSADFGLLIGDRRIATARETQDQRLNLMFLVDVSGSMRGAPLNDIKSALPAFLATARGHDQFALTFFADEDRLQSSFEEPRDQLTEALRTARPQGKQTKLYRALYNALRLGRQNDPRTRRIIVVLSDGRDEGSDVTLAQVIAESRARLVPIYAVFRGEIESFADVLYGLSNAAGGDSFSTHSRHEIANALDTIYRLETNSVAVRFTYDADRGGRGGGPATQNAVIELRRPSGPALRATLSEKIPALRIPESRTPWLLILALIALAVVLGGGGAYWFRRRTPPTPAKTVKATIDYAQTTTTVDIRPSPAAYRQTVVIGQSFPPPASGRPAVLLRGLSGALAGREHAMEREICSIGADAESDLPIEDEYVSGTHAYLRYEQGSLFIFDKGSRNGTFVNGSRVPDNGLVLRPGDQVSLGGSTFAVVMPGP